MNLSEFVSECAANFSNTFSNNCINNDIQPAINADTCKQTLQYIITALVSHASSRNTSEAINILAKKYNDIILVQVKFKENYQASSPEKSIENFKPFAESIGGCIYVTYSNGGYTTLSLTFLNRRMNLTA